MRSRPFRPHQPPVRLGSHTFTNRFCTLCKKWEPCPRSLKLIQSCSRFHNQKGAEPMKNPSPISQGGYPKSRRGRTRIMPTPAERIKAAHNRLAQKPNPAASPEPRAIKTPQLGRGSRLNRQAPHIKSPPPATAARCPPETCMEMKSRNKGGAAQ